MPQYQEKKFRTLVDKCYALFNNNNNPPYPYFAYDDLVKLKGILYYTDFVKELFFLKNKTFINKALDKEYKKLFNLAKECPDYEPAKYILGGNPEFKAEVLLGAYEKLIDDLTNTLDLITKGK
jgi:hypothetical protein